MEKIAIIGMGTSGMAVLAAYAKEVDKNLIQIDCYDTKESFGRGYPYREDADDLILNLKTRKISYNYQDNDDLAKWLKEKGKEEKEYTSRAVFGEYTRDRLEEDIKKIDANKIYEKVIRLDKLDNKWELESESGLIKVYDRVHLCNGEVSQKSIFYLEENKNYIQDIYPLKDKISCIKEDDKVCIIGLGLTGVDVATHLIEKKNLKNIYMFSRTTLIPTVRVAPTVLEIKILTMNKLDEILSNNYNRISFEEFDNLFNEELKAQDINFGSFVNRHMQGGIEQLKTNISEPDELARVQALLPIMNLIFNKVWDAFSKEDRKLFREKYHPFMTLNRSPLPLLSANLLIEANDKGNLQVLKAVDNIKEKNGKFILFKEESQVVDIEFDYIINATGLDSSMKNIEFKNPLLKSIIDKRYVLIDEYGGFSLNLDKMSAISPRYGNLDNLHVHGVLASGVQYRNNSTLIMQITAHSLIKKLYNIG